MAVKIRLTRCGKKKFPIYRIVVLDSRKKRDGEYLENLGTYDATAHKIVQIHESRIQHWLSVGAEISDAAAKLIKMHKKQESVVAN